MRAALIAILALGSLFTAGCIGAPDDADGHVAEAQQGQVDLGTRVSRRVTMTFTDTHSTPFAALYVFSRSTGTYHPGTEYWFVNEAAVGLLGAYSLDVDTVDSDVTVDPPEPDQPGWQAFTQVEYPTSGWGAWWASDPLSSGVLYIDGRGVGLRLHTSTSGEVSEVAWYQVIPATQSPRYLTPGGRFSVGGAAMAVPRGYRGYSIDQVVQ